MISLSSYSLSNKEYVLLMDDEKDVRETEFKVYIPRFMPKVDNSGSAEIKDVKLDKSRIVNINFKAADTTQEANYVVAKSGTYFRTKYKGNVKEGGMEKSKGETELEDPFQLVVHGGEHSIPPHTDPELQHIHKIIKPFEFTEMVYEDLDRFKIQKGHKMIGEFIGDSINDLWISFIPEVLPKL